MADSNDGHRNGLVATLRRITRPASRRNEEQCELCCIQLASEHRHLLEMPGGTIVCACDPCALRFQAVIGGRYKLIPRDTRMLWDLRITDEDWENLALPINLAFILKDSRANKVTAMYPSPAGATESLLPMDVWEAYVRKNPVLAELEADIEALLVNRVGTARDYFITPVDVCYRLVGLIRLHWRGLSGGTVVWHEIEMFFSSLKERSRHDRPKLEAMHA